MLRSIEHTMLPATAYIMLVVSATWSFFLLFVTHKTISLGFLTFILFFGTGTFGTWHYVNLYRKKISLLIRNCLKLFKSLSSLFALPLIVADLYMKYHFSFELSIAHLVLPLFTLALYGTNIPADKSLLHFRRSFPQNRVKETKDFVIFCEVISLAIVSSFGANLFGMAAAFVYALMQFLITEDGYIDEMKMPAEPVFISGMGVFCLLGMRSLMAC